MQPTPRYRIRSIDILRGIIMIIMALDHTRDYFHLSAIDPLDPEKTHITLYLTRWITHFCAPTFVFLSGISAYLSSRRKTPGEASVFLIKRGLWLVVIEIVVVTLGITGNPFYNVIVFQVIWAIGVSMVLLGLLSPLGRKAVLVIGLVLFFGHDLIFYASLPRTGALANVLNLSLTARAAFIPLTKTHAILDLYAVLPWTSAMLVGYGLGYWFDKEYAGEKRRRQLIITGFSLTTLFFALRLINHYGDPAGWQKMDTPLKTMFSFFRVSKYPPSLMYLCATLGPSTLALALLERARGKWTDVASVYGKVPFFYYILHFYLLHITLIVFFFATGHTTAQIFSPNGLIAFQAPGFGYSLVVVYIIWISVVAALYLPCRWFSRYKMEHRQWWLSYL